MAHAVIPEALGIRPQGLVFGCDTKHTHVEVTYWPIQASLHVCVYGFSILSSIVDKVFVSGFRERLISGTHHTA